MKILSLKCDCVVTSCLESDHGTSGHLFEMIEYFYVLKFLNQVDCKLLIPFKFSLDKLKNALLKYDFSNDELNTIFRNTIFNFDTEILKCRNAIFVDGLISYRKKAIVLSDNIILIRCARECDGEKANIILQDERLYDDFKEKSIPYIKKILFSKFKKCKLVDKNIAYVHATRACRNLSTEILKKLSNMPYKIFIGSDQPYSSLPKNCTNIALPIENFFDHFGTYIYTPVGGFCPNFDCSPRLPAECKFLKKDFILLAPLNKVLKLDYTTVKTI